MRLSVLDMPGQLQGVPQATDFDLQPDPVRPVLSIGRQAGNDVILADSSVSRRHAEIQVRAEGIFVRDLDSANGTFLNNERLAPQTWLPVRPGDRLRIGNVITRLDGDSTELPTTTINTNEAGSAYNPTAVQNYPVDYASNQAGYNSAGMQPNQPGYNQGQPGYNPSSYGQPPPGYNQGQPGINNIPPSAGYTPPPPPTSAGYNAYSPNPENFRTEYAPVQPPTANQRPAYDNYAPDPYNEPYAVQYQQPLPSYPPQPLLNQASAATPVPRRNSPLLIIVPLIIAVVLILGVGGFFLLKALNNNTTNYTTLDNLKFPAAPASPSTAANILGINVTAPNAWKRTDDIAGNRVVFAKPGQPSTALTIEKPPSPSLRTANLSADVAVQQYVANVQANAQNVQVTTQPVTVKLKDGSLATIAQLQFTVPNTVTDYHMTALGVQCNGSLYFVTAAAEAKSDDTTTDSDLKGAISNTSCK